MGCRCGGGREGRQWADHLDGGQDILGITAYLVRGDDEMGFDFFPLEMSFDDYHWLSFHVFR